jgi:predicted transcriptional regulator YdeE
MSRIHHHTVADPITIAGLQIRTDNTRELSGEGGIGKLWQRFFAEDILARIVNRTSDVLYAVYSNYESDEYGAYDFLIGAPVSSVDTLPEGLTFAAIATGRYAVVTTEKGPVQEMVPGAWREIWQMPASELDGERAFLTDYEVYGERATDPANAEVEIYLGLEPEVE